ncbi:MAG: YqeG family HAD IIIA-type phosphatase [Ruminococcus sp.]|jgi:HAD superfamily phosphatase (TIGR01668 family)|nr:YqeG family HAD IIIA-type phosphatase [Ruminococcus sp.]
MFKPTCSLKSITDISPEMLSEMKVTGLLLDIDNTLTTHDNPIPGEGVQDWIETMKKQGIGLILVSNNHFDRVKPFAEIFGLDFTYDSKKPLSVGLKLAVKKLNLHKKNVAVVGDQIFTDILGANLFGVKSILLDPIELETTRFFKLKRYCEKLFR